MSAGCMEFTVSGTWVSERKRQVSRGRFTRRIDTPDRAAFKQRVAWAAKLAMAGTTPLEGPLRVTFRFYALKPVSWPKNACAGNRWPGAPWKKPDLTNLTKIVEDALSGIVWLDDAQVIEFGEGHGKLWGDSMRVEIKVEALGVQP